MSYETRCVCCDVKFIQNRRRVKERDQICDPCEKVINTARSDFFYQDFPDYAPRFFVLREFDSDE